MTRRWVALGLKLAIAVLWPLAVFRLVAHFLPMNLDNPVVRLVLQVTAPLVGQFQWQASDFAIFQEGLGRSVAAVVILSFCALAVVILSENEGLDISKR